MKYKLLVIFFIAIVLTLLIYKLTYKDNINILSLGSNLSKGKTPFNGIKNGYDYYLKKYLNKEKNYSYINYVKTENNLLDTLLESIKNYKEVIVKGKKKNINQIVSKSDYIILDLNDNKTISKCNNKDYLLFVNKKKDEVEKLLKIIRKINNNTVLILGIYCKNNDKKIENEIDKIMIFDNKTIYINLYRELNTKYYYLPNNNYLYPSLEGYNHIANLIHRQMKS